MVGFGEAHEWKVRAVNVFERYRGNLDWLAARTIFLTKHGSHAYGTNTATSDIDIKGVCVAPARYYHGFVDSFGQADSGFEGLDCAIYDLRKFFKLAAENNPNVIELLFVDESCWLHSDTASLWRKVLDHRDLFLSQNVKWRFSGYAVAQLKRIQTHRAWLLNPPKKDPTRTEHGLPEFKPMPLDQLQAAENQIKKQLEAWEVDYTDMSESDKIAVKSKISESFAEIELYSDASWTAAGRKLGFDDNFLEHLQKERGYRGAKAHWKQYQNWVATRNPIRAALEAKHGFDTKHAMHLVRLLRMAREILAGEGVKVKRPDAEELLAVRNGAWSFDQLMEWKDRAMAEVETALATTKLPRNPDRKRLDAICTEVVEEML